MQPSMDIVLPIALSLLYPFMILQLCKLNEALGSLFRPPVLDCF